MEANKENYAVSTEIARQAIPFMSERGIPITPVNYEIWYEYFRGNMEELKEDLSGMLRKGNIFDEDTHQSLYQRHFARGGNKETQNKLTEEMRLLTEANEAARSIFTPLSDELAALAKNSDDYFSQLDNAAQSIQDKRADENIEEIIETLKSATTEFSAESSNVGMSIGSYSDQLEELKISLDKAMEEARLDELTGVGNRRFFNETFSNELAWAKGSGKTSYLAMLDIDHFKKVNDKYGHIVGDNALVAIAGILGDTLAARGALFRFGGEEFSVVLRDYALKDACEIAEELRVAIENNAFTIRGMIEKITISVGVSGIKGGGGPMETLKKADDALYLAKASGRNLVKTEHDLG